MTRQMVSKMIAGIFAAMTLLCAASTVHAQGVPWGGCPNTTICNNTPCTVRLAMNMIPVASPVYTVPPGPCIVVGTPGVTSIASVVSAGGNMYPVLPPTMTPCNCPLTNWSVCCVTLPSPATCCVDICFDPVTCTITINPAVCPIGTCRP